MTTYDGPDEERLERETEAYEDGLFRCQRTYRLGDRILEVVTIVGTVAAWEASPEAAQPKLWNPLRDGNLVFAQRLLG